MADFQRENIQRINNPDLEDEYGNPLGLGSRTRNAAETQRPDKLVISPNSNYTPQAVNEYANKYINNKTPKTSIFSGLFSTGGKKSKKSRKSKKSKKSRKTRRRRRRRM
jgi:hypothetical protein